MKHGCSLPQTIFCQNYQFCSVIQALPGVFFLLKKIYISLEFSLVHFILSCHFNLNTKIVVISFIGSNNSLFLIYIIIRYWVVRWFCDSVCPFAIENTFPLSNFKTKHIFGILMTLRTFLKLRAPQATPKTSAEGAWNMGRRWHPKFSFIFFFYRRRRQRKNGHRGRPKRGAEGAVPPEGDGNPAERQIFREYMYIQPKKKKSLTEKLYSPSSTAADSAARQ